MTRFIEVIKKNYETYKESVLKDRFFKHNDIVPLIKKMGNNELCQVEEVGKSFEQRSIYSIKIGVGETVILLWSQMHGDEPTATGAIFDILNFLTADDELNEYRRGILDKLTLFFVPMLNPDGTERFTRENAQGIDINRDALALSSPEGKILKQICKKTNAEYAFNLHDQKTQYSAGNTDKPATISFLASVFNAEREINERRKKAMQTIVAMNNALQLEIAGMVARYYDDFMPNAFGDNIVKWGSSLILVESGGYSGEDTEKQEVRRLNFYGILVGLQSIAGKQNLKENYENYFQLPINKKDKLFDILLRNVKFSHNNYEYTSDIGILHKVEIDKNTGSHSIFYYIAKIGDLSNYFGYVDFDAKLLRFKTTNNHETDGNVAVLNSTADFVLLNENDDLAYKIENGKIISQQNTIN